MAEQPHPHFSPATMNSSPQIKGLVQFNIDNSEQDNTSWKQGLSFLSDYGYDLNEISRDTRIHLQNENSLNAIRGRAAPTVEVIVVSYS